MKRLSLAISLVLILLCGFAAKAPANPPKANYYDKDSDLIIVTGSYAPFTGQTLKGKGLYPRIVSAVLNRLNISHKILFLGNNWNGCESEVKDMHTAWATLPYSYTDERSHIYAYSKFSIPSATKFFYYKKLPPGIQIHSVDDIKKNANGKYPVRIAGAEGFYYISYFSTPEFDFTLYDTEKEALESMIFGYENNIPDRINLIPLNIYTGGYLIKKEFKDHVDHFKALNFNFRVSNTDTSRLYLIVDKGLPQSIELLKRFDAEASKFRKSPAYQKILNEYQ